MGWYAHSKRDLPWRRTKDPYLIWISEVMLQQTRVAAALPYFERFIQRFPAVQDLAAAPESDVLHAWAGLGYYSRARNLREAARLIIGLGAFPNDYDCLRALPGIGDYTAAAVGSIAFGLPYAAIDGNALRVLSRVTAEPGDIGLPAIRERLTAVAKKWLDRKQPGDFNQAVMELGATICLPQSPHCSKCPLARQCEAHATRREEQYPVKLRKAERNEAHETLYYIEHDGDILLWQRPPDSDRLAGFWELPGPLQLADVSHAEEAGRFRHSIVNTTYNFTVVRATASAVPQGLSWVTKASLDAIPLSTTARKAMLCVEVD